MAENLLLPCQNYFKRTLGLGLVGVSDIFALFPASTIVDVMKVLLQFLLSQRIEKEQSIRKRQMTLFIVKNSLSELWHIYGSQYVEGLKKWRKELPVFLYRARNVPSGRRCSYSWSKWTLDVTRNTMPLVFCLSRKTCHFERVQRLTNPTRRGHEDKILMLWTKDHWSNFSE